MTRPAARPAGQLDLTERTQLDELCAALTAATSTADTSADQAIITITSRTGRRVEIWRSPDGSCFDWAWAYVLGGETR